MTQHPPTPAASTPSGVPTESAPAPAPARPAGRPHGPRPSGGGPGDRRFARRPRRKVCSFCVEKVKRIDYKDAPRLRRYLSDRAKIEPRRKTGSCAKHQRMLTTALKLARHMAMLPYTAEHIREMMPPQMRALAGGPPPPKPERLPRVEAPVAPPPPPSPSPTPSAGT